MLIREAIPDDLPFLAEIEASAMEVFRGSVRAGLLDLPLPPPEAFRAFVAKGLAWIAEFDGQPAGFAVCETYPDAMHLAELSVRHEFQRRGVGRALIGRVIRAAETLGLRAVTLSTYRDIPWNAPYYLRLGFAELTPHELSPKMRETLAREAEALGDPAARCFMRLTLPIHAAAARTSP